MEQNTRTIVQTALFVALSVVLGYALAQVPNVELMTVSVFLSGLILGPARGIFVGVLSIFIYSMLNPFGPPPPPLLIAQVMGFLLIGAAGGLLRGPIRGGGKRSFLLCALAGFLLTLAYDAATTASTALIALGPDGFMDGVWGFFALGAPFVIAHVITNTLIFALIVLPTQKAVSSFRGGGEG